MTPRPRPALLGAALVLPLALSPAAAQSACGDWTVVDVPLQPEWSRAHFEDVSILPDGTAWAVGQASLPIPPYFSEEVTLAMRFDGTGWEHTPTPYVAPYPGGANDNLHAVAALAADDVWAAGARYGDAGGLSVGAWLHVLHWDGGAWSEVAVPEPPGGAGINFSGLRVYDIAALGTDDVWFAGLWGEPNDLAAVTWRPLAMHWDGSGMVVHDTPVIYFGGYGVHLRQVSALASDDVWGVCRTNTAGGWTDEPVVLHWDGGSWSQVAAPSLGEQVALDDVVAVAPDDVWVFGRTYWPQTPFALHWDGSGFSVRTDVPFTSTATASATGELLLGNEVVRSFDGTAATVVADLAGVTAPALLGSDAAGECRAWLVGRRAGPTGGGQVPLAVFRGDGGSASGTVFCAGDGLAGPCPCGNGRPAPEGCAHSGGVGMTLRLVGSPSVSADDWSLVAEQCPPGNSGIFFCGTQSLATGLPLYDGLQCVGGSVLRFRPRFQTDGVASDTGFVAQDPVGGYWVAGETYGVQYWSRDVAGGTSPCGTLANLSPALAVTPVP